MLENIRDAYRPLVEAVTTAGFFVTMMPMDQDQDRIVCFGEYRDKKCCGNSFWFSECGGNWFVGAWGGYLYHLVDVKTACLVAVNWLTLNSTHTDADVPDDLKTTFGLVIADDIDFC